MTRDRKGWGGWGRGGGGCHNGGVLDGHNVCVPRSPGFLNLKLPLFATELIAASHGCFITEGRSRKGGGGYDERLQQADMSTKLRGAWVYDR